MRRRLSKKLLIPAAALAIALGGSVAVPDHAFASVKGEGGGSHVYYRCVYRYHYVGGYETQYKIGSNGSWHDLSWHLTCRF